MTESGAKGTPVEPERREESTSPSGDEGPFGEFLTRHRERRRLSLDQASAAVRIPVRYLEALEAEEYADLPPVPYVRGFLDAYARFLGIEPASLIRRFEEGLREHRRQHREEGRGAIFALFRPRGDKLHWRDWAIPILLALAVAAFITGKWFLDATTLREGTPPAPLPATGLPAPAPVAQPPLADPELVSRAPGEPPVEAGVRLRLTAEGSTWVAAGRDGGEVEEWSLKGGETREVTARKEIVLSLGNAGVVKISYNGRELGFIGRKGQVKRDLLFTAPAE